MKLAFAAILFALPLFGQIINPPSSGGGTGTVTSVGVALPTALVTCSGSPVTTSGTVNCTFATGQTANQVLSTVGGNVGFTSTVPGTSHISYGTAATDSGNLSAELTTSGTTTSTGWTGSYNSYSNGSSNTSPLTYAPSISNGTLYEVVVTVSGYSAGSISITFAGNTLSNMSSNSTQTIGPSALSTAGLVITPTSTFVGTVTASIKSISKVSTYAFIGQDSTGANSFVISQPLASLGDIFVGGGGGYNTTGYYNLAVGVNALYSNTTGYQNNAVGAYALQNNTTGNYNLAVGAYALQNNTTGNQNNAVGAYALQNNTTGYYNLAVGVNALYSNTTGYQNNAVGVSALYSNTTGNQNNAVGASALYSNTTGYQNNAVGAYALQNNTTGNYNLAVGASALQNNTTGYQNNAVGVNALQNNTTGNQNNAVGVNALQNNTTGSNNLADGYQAGYGSGGNAASIIDSQVVFLGALASRDSAIPNTTSLTNIACIGYNCKVAANNTVEVGNRSNTSVILNGVATESGTRTTYIQGSSTAPSVSISGTGTCTLAAATGTNISGLISVTGACTAATITLTWSGSLAYTNHSLCSALQDRTSGVLSAQTSDTTTTAVFKVATIAASDVLQYGTCTGY